MQARGGPYGMQSSSNPPPMQQMARMSLGPQAYQPSGNPSNTQSTMSSFPQRSSMHAQQNSFPPASKATGPPSMGSFPQRTSQYSQMQGQGQVPPQQNQMGMPPPMQQGGGMPPPPQQQGPPGHQQGGGQHGMNVGPPTSGVFQGPPSQPMQNSGAPSFGMNTGPPPSGQPLAGHPSGQLPSGQSSGFSMGPTGLTMGPPSGATQSMQLQGPPAGPPGMSTGPPAGPPGQSTAPSRQSMGPPGTLNGPPGQGAAPVQGMPTGPPPLGPTAPPMSSGQTGQMSMGPPGQMGPAGPGALGMSSGPPGPRGQMSMGPSPQMGAPGQGMPMGPPGGAGLHMGPPRMPSGGGGQGPPGMSMGPPGMSTGPPGMTTGGGPRMSAGPPGPGGPTGGGQGPPGMSMGPPGPGGPGMGAGGGQGMTMGPPGPGGLNQGPVQQQPRSRIDPDHMPNPVEVMKSDQDQRGGATPYHTSTRGLPPPLVTTKFIVQDDGNASPRYMRSTLYTVPCSKDMLNSTKIPLGLIVQPMAEVPQSENTLHLVDHGSGGPIRCNRCKAYMNPYSRFVDGGRRYLCPICQCSNEVAPEYFCHLDHQGQRTDAMQRPELSFGSVEYVANKDYCKEGKLPRPPAYIFMIDVSYGNVQSGLLNLLFNSILGILDSLPGSGDEEGSPIRVGFVTYDRVIQFYNVKASIAQPQMMVMTDVDDVFVPMVDGFLVNVTEARTVLESLMSQLPEIFASNNTPQVVLEPVVRAGMEALKAAGRNGRLFVFHSSLPSAQATGMLKNRLDTKLLGTDKEKSLLNPVSSPYQKLAEECVKYGVAVELFLFPSAYADVATLASFAATTGGELHYYKNYKSSSDGDRLLEDLQHSLTRPTGFDCVMRVRASTGLRPTGFYGAFFMSNTTDIELGNIDCDKAIAVEIRHDDKLRDDETAFFQAALLYTDIYGQRKLRIHNLALNCSSKFPDMYRSCEIDTIINFLSKSILTASLTMSYKNIRENFTRQCAVILSCYRKHCSSQSPAGQLILPESLKLLPMYANCILKSDALLSPPIVSIDEKCWLMHCLLSMPTSLAGSFIYPRMFSLHDLDVNENEFPPIMRCTGQKLQDSGLYVVENGIVMVLWVGLQLSSSITQKLFGVPSTAQISPEMHSLPALDNALSFRVRGILEQLQASRQYCMKLIVSKQKDKGEVFFRRLLKEDKGAGQWEGITYIDFLCQIHREIKEILS